MTAAVKSDRWAGPKGFIEAATAPASFVLGVLLMAFFMLVLPGVVIYTVVWGERAVATVEVCEQRKPMRDTEFLDCRGEWRFADGTRGSGHVSGVGRADIGREVPVRVGPIGPYAGGLDRSRHAVIPGALMWAATLPVVGVVFFFHFRARARARWVLAQVGEGTGSSVTGRRRFRDGRGRTLLRFRASARPPSALAGAGLGERRFATRRPFVAAHAPSEEIAFFAARLAGGFAVFAPGGRLTLVVRSVTHSPPRLELLAPDRTPLGRIVPYPGSEDQPGVAFSLTTETGEPVAVIVARFLRWTVVLHGDPPEPLCHAAMTFAFDALRLTK
ncbi:hypothetical protein E1200_14205 [Actinomadura sp. GC306]|uniref:hypothetical protein n=1 Tax=Actinomadura sp. GC306 TaxID=2530367 RepID=UPI0010445CB4|nr:hypothetical protein [Actinomadura sp. GC306]TDC67698.1 hypothetical protein E1200_14205 [Actinomadura sp. GC306]